MIYHQKWHGKNKILIADKYICLDTETSWNHDEENPIGWITSIQVLFDGDYYLFRKPSEFIEYLRSLIDRFGLDEEKRIVIYIHNASYDLTYLFQWLEDIAPHDDMIAIAYHKIIMVRFGPFIFRCSYKLSNKSLEKWGRDLNTVHKKLVGSYDYSKVIYQDDILDEQELQYDKMDVLALNDCISQQMKYYNDTIATIPITSTGYIRRTSRYNAKKNPKNRDTFKRSALTVHTYKHITKVKSGGMTHGNRKLRAKTIRFKTRHGDFRSHYPSQLRCYKLPSGAWFTLADINDGYTINDILDEMDKYAFMVDIIIKDMRLHKEVTIPFAQSYKFEMASFRSNNFHVLDDNGRILKMDGFAQVTLSGQMLKILYQQYDFEYEIIEVMASRLDYIPNYLKYTIDTYFKQKSDLKDICEKYAEEYGDFDERTIEANINLMKSKNGLNGIFGMCMTDPVRVEFEYDEDLNDWEAHRVLTDEAIFEKLEKYYNSRNNFLNYSIGVFVTELAKYELYEYILAIGYENIIYCDTDSIFFKDNEKSMAAIEALNAKKEKNAEAIGAYIITDKGKKIYYDHFSMEPDIETFRFLHSKCYAYIDEKRKELHATIAGIPADNGKKGADKVTREEELGCIDNLYDGFTFHQCGGTIAKYVKRNKGIEIINGHEIEIGNACIIMEVDKQISKGDINIMDDEDDLILEEWGIVEDD